MDDAAARILAELGAIRAEMATRADITAVKAELDSIRGDIMARIDRLQDELTGVRQGDELTWAIVRRAEKMARDAQGHNDILIEQLDTMTRLVRSLEGRVSALEHRL